MEFEKDLITLKSYSKEQIQHLLELSSNVKQKMKKKELYQPLKGYSMSMIFQKRSTRTRVSTETGMAYLGGHSLFLGKDDIQLGKNESLKDTALVLSRFNDLILARVFAHSDVEELATHSKVPVINALSDTYHPLQILADYLTIREHFGKLEGLTIAWVGDGNNVLHSFMVSAAKLGINLRVTTPHNFRPNSEIIDYAKTSSNEHNTEFLLTDDPKEGVKGADIIVTDTWVSMGQDEEYEARIKAFNGYQVTEELGKFANPNWKFMHCLPRKQHEVNDEVFYSKRSIVFDEAENRMYTVMAVILALLRMDK